MMKQIRLAAYAAAVFAVFFLMTGCGGKKPQDVISEELGINVSGGREVSNLDSHGGFHGDGTTCIVLQFSDERVLEQIKEDEQWKAFPLDEVTGTLVYGTERKAENEMGNEKENRIESIGPFLTDGEGEALIPEIEDGYYRLIDRQVKPGEAAGADILHRSSFIFTLGIYDAGTDRLYFCKLDT